MRVKHVVALVLIIIVWVLQMESIGYFPPSSPDKGQYCFDMFSHVLDMRQFTYVVYAVLAIQIIAISLLSLMRKYSYLLMIVMAFVPLLWPRLAYLCN
jgi:hypothetical protein